VELATERLDHLLANKATKHRRHGVQLARGACARQPRRKRKQGVGAYVWNVKPCSARRPVPRPTRPTMCPLLDQSEATPTLGCCRTESVVGAQQTHSCV
jgi:hypothetical protein